MHANSSRAQSFAILALSLHAAAAWAAGPDPGINVTVTNPTSKPVPVSITGGATVSGTVAATQNGNWNVGVINSSAAPVVVQDVTKQNLFFVGGFATVPPGKVYVVEHWATKCNVPATTAPSVGRLVAFVSGPQVSIEDYAVPHLIQPNGTAGGAPVNLWGASASPTIRLPEGTQFSVQMAPLGSGCTESVSGYIVDAN